jgi:hypothetical protein
MNRISLYEAIRRKKESQGLNTAATKHAPVSDPSQRTEPRVQLKQPLGQEKPVIPAKPVVKSPLIRPLSQRSSLIRKTQKSPWLKLDGILSFLKKNPMSVKIGIGGLILVVVIVGLISLLSGPQTDSDQLAKNTVAVNNSSQKPTTIVEKKEPEQKPVVIKIPEQKPVVIKQEEKPAPVQQKPVVPAPVKQVQVPKPEPKAQIPAAIKDQLQKQAEAVQPQTPKPTGKGDNVIVIATYTKQEDLTPVAAYFRQNGIETDFIREGSYYQLVTKERFENPVRSGTDGYRMIQTIKRIGANYKAPTGYERFSSTPFQDAYGKKVK